MYDGMRSTHPTAALYFLFTFIFGNYVMLNLFLAILLDQFAAGDATERRDTDLQGACSEAIDFDLPRDTDMAPAIAPRDPTAAADEHARQIAVAQRHAAAVLLFHVRDAQAPLASCGSCRAPARLPSSSPSLRSLRAG